MGKECKSNEGMYLVSYIDIMGFTNLVEDRFRNDYNKVYQIIDRFRGNNKVANHSYFSKSYKHKVKIKFFSDCVLRYIPVDLKMDWKTLQALDFEVFQLLLIQMDLLEQGIFIRGCMNIGRLYCDKDIVFGKAFNVAYDYETTKVKYPVIVLSKLLSRCLEMCKFYKDYRNCFPNLSLLCDTAANNFSHELTYLNYLHQLTQCRMDFDQKHTMNFIESHKYNIMHELVGIKNEDVRKKFLWLREYHNHYVPRFAEITGRNDLLIL